LTNEVRPSDIYCYLGARFGHPNGLQNFFRNDDSDNLIHWEWYLKTSIGYITFAGLNFRTDIWIHGTELPDTEKQSLIGQIKADFSKYAKEMQHIRRVHLEPWIEFVNPYQRLRRAIKQLLEELDALGLNPEADAMPNLLESEDLSRSLDHWRTRAADYSRAIGLSFGIRAMIPVMAESFVNLLLFLLARTGVKEDKQLFKGIFRLPMNMRIASLPYYCTGFENPVDLNHSAMKDYLKIVDSRNDLLHGNIDIEKLKFNELYFAGKVPIFNSYSTMWERSLGVAHRAVGLSEVRAELAKVDAFTDYLTCLLTQNVRDSVEGVSRKFDLGIRKDTGQIGVLFPDHLVDFGMAADQPGAAQRAVTINVIRDGPPEPHDGEQLDGADRV